jgi:membrane-bound serine protease (ClpP class)
MSDPAVTVAALLVAGYLLLAVELFVIPGFGVVGILGIACLLAGCYFANHFFGAAYGALAIVLVLASTTAVLLWIPRSGLGKDVVHSTTLGAARSADTRVQEGQVGVAESDLRPAGIARFGELRESVVTEGEFLDAGSRVVVTAVRGSRIVVEQASADTERSTST